MAFPALLAALAGCREELGPVKYTTTRVVGVVSEGGRPVKGGWIEFVPIEGTVGNLRSAPIAADGRFEATGVAVGRNAIGLVAAPIGLQGARERFLTVRTPIRRDIPPGPATTIEIDLVTEMIRAEAQARTTQRASETSR